MKKHLLALFGLALFLAACGGGTPPPPSSITLTVEDPMGSFNAAAYQVGTGSWQLLSMTGTTTKTATIPMNNQTKYGVAVRCSSLVVKVIQATSTELANPKIECSSPAPSTVSFTVNVSISASLLAAGDLCVNDSNCQSVGNNNSVSITLNLEPGTRDLLVTLKDSSGLVKVAKVAKGVNVTSGGNTSVSLGSGDVTNPVSLTVPPPPQGYTSSPAALVAYLSANGTASGSVNASFTSYRPVSGFGSGDLYWAFIVASGPNATLTSLQFFNSGAPSLAFPAPWGSGSLTVTQTAHPTVTGLARSDPDLQGYEISLACFGQLYYTATLSKAWLGSAGSYALPDLSTQLGYTPLQRGDSASFSVTALLSNKTTLSTNFTNPSGFAAGDYIRLAEASTTLMVGNPGSVTFP